MKILYVPAVEALRELVWVSVISFCKISFPVKHLMPYYAETARSRGAQKTSLGPSYFVLLNFIPS